MSEEKRLDVTSDRLKRYVTMSNDLARAAHGLSLSEKRLICCALSRIDSARVVAYEMLSSRVYAHEYADAFGVHLNTAYDQLKSGAQHLYQRSITFFEPAYSRKGKPIAPTRVQMRWVGKVKYQEEQAWVDLFWWPEVVPHLTFLRNKFATYELSQASALRSTYSWRLLELFHSFNTGWCDIEVGDFAEMMDAKPSHRANFSNLRQKIIEPAVKELVEKEGWNIQWKPIKYGRKVARLRFDFHHPDHHSGKPTPAKKAKPALEEKINGVPKSVVEQHARVGETYEAAAYRIRRERIKY